MTSDECNDFLSPALVNLFGTSSVMGALELDKLLGVDWYEEFYNRGNFNSDHRPLSEEAKNMYKMLAGPHADTILKAWKIKKDLGHEEINKENQTQD